MGVDFAEHIVDIYHIGESIDDVDSWIVVGGEPCTIACNRARGPECTTCYFQTGRADIVRNYSAKKRCVDVGNRIRNAVGTIASGKDEAVSRSRQRDH